MVIDICQPTRVFGNFRFDFWQILQNIILDPLIAFDKLCMGLARLGSMDEIRLEAFNWITQNNDNLHA